ncbi:hypothetical protein TruAng_010255 [Truncatella angustata]|nr:hypothetical protein TruAng_010255 [Truncatella angustata]
MLQGIDPSLFPVLKTRRALVIVDAQNDFLSADGPLHIDVPGNLTDRIIQLVTGFRPYGDIVWIWSEYSQPRPARSEQIIVSDTPIKDSRRSSSSRGKRQANGGDQPPSRCAEAFLSGPAPGRPECVRKGSDGAKPPTTIQELMGKKDMSFVKTHYSAFQIPDLIQRLRMKFVSEVFICGSLSNIGVMATAIDAGCHGLDIGIIEDCCGRRDDRRHAGALARIQEMTGCEVLSTDKILERLKPKPKVQRQLAAPIPNPSGRRYPVVYDASSGNTDGNEEMKASNESSSSTAPATANLASSMAKMSLSNQAEDELPPITFTRARVAIRGRPARPLLDIEKRFGEQLRDPDAMYDKINSSLGIGSESHNGGSGLSVGIAQPQTTPEARRQEKVSEGKQSIVNTSETTKADSVAITTKISKLDYGESAQSTVVPRQAQTFPSTMEKATTVIKAKTLPPTDTTTVRSTLDYSQQTPANIGAKEEITREANNMSIGESEPLCEGDTRVIYNVLPHPLSDNIFKKIKDEVEWKRMSHQGGEVPRLVAVQGEVDQEGNTPVYRHPADESPPLLRWTPAIKDIKDVVERKVGHPLNHALIQYYRDGTDYISEHSDKTLDIAKNSFIVNVSLGAERTMTLRTKRHPKPKDAPQPQSTVDGPKREVQRARLPHNSMCKMGLQTNMRWLHAIRQDHRLDRDKTEEELAYGGARISLTFRQIGTFLDREQKMIWGQGAKAKTKEAANEVINGQTSEAVKMLQAFGRENQSTEFDWEESYGSGFDVLHISAAPRLFTSSDPVANLRVQLMLAELGVGHAKGSLAPVSTSRERQERRSGDPLIKLADNDQARTTVRGDVAIMMYIDRFYGKHSGDSSERPNIARAFERFQEALTLDPERSHDPKCLGLWEAYAEQADYIAGGASISIADFAFWPMLHETLGSNSDSRAALENFPNLKAYYSRIRASDTIVKMIGKEKEVSSPKSSKLVSPSA